MRASSARFMSGLSPPTRGNLSCRRPNRPCGRSIPAHAGEPGEYPKPPLPPKVYPRPRGGTLFGRPGVNPIPGLSPPTRGNPRGTNRLWQRRRSIPAHAGEPELRGWRPFRRSVYPRPRGGTKSRTFHVGMSRGLSPPTRGNRSCGRAVGRRPRSIPAHAGEPGIQPRRRRPAGVYPRPRGGTRLVFAE